MAKSCFCYTTDKNYMAPTLLSALQARRNVAPEKVDVIVLYVGARDDHARLFEQLCLGYGVGFQVVPPSSIDHLPVNVARHFSTGCSIPPTRP